MTFTQANAGDYIFRPKPGISYKRSCHAVILVENNTITLLDCNTGIMRTLSSEQFDYAKFEPITREMIALEFDR